MTTKAFSATLFRVHEMDDGKGGSTPFHDAIYAATHEPTIADREKTISARGRRLDSWQFDPGSILLLNMLSFKYEGEGRVRSGQPSRNISMGVDEHFAPEAAVLYDMSNRMALIESSTSITHGIIARYFREFANGHTKYEMEAVLANDVAALARGFQTIRSVQIGTYIRQPTAADREAGMDNLQAFSAPSSGEHIEITVTAGRSRKNSLSRDFVGRVLDLVSGSSQASAPLTKLQLKGKENDDDPLALLDVLHHTIKPTVTLPIDPTSRKVHHRDRWLALKDMYLFL